MTATVASIAPIPASRWADGCYVALRLAGWGQASFQEALVLCYIVATSGARS